MANTVTLSGYFGVKQAFHVSDPNVTTGWYAGQLFKIDSIGLSGAGTLKGAVVGKGPFVGLNDTSGAAIAGVALENSSDVTTAVSGMQHPSGSKVTILHGHSVFSIQTTAADRSAGNMPWESEVESASLMSLLYASANGKWASFRSTNQVTAQPIGYLSQVPAGNNSWTMGVVLFG